MKTILVIGGGLIGAASALRLQQAGLRVALFDPGDKRRAASFGNAGHIGAEQVMPWSQWRNVWRAPAASFAAGGPLDVRWRDIGSITPWALQFLEACDREGILRGAAALKALLSDALGAWLRLAADLDAPEMVLPHGHVTAWLTPRAADAGRAAAVRTDWGTASWRELTDVELARYASVMRRPPCAGISFGGTGQVSDPQGVRDAILLRFSELGGEVTTGKATGVGTGGSVTLADGSTRQADLVLIAAGAWSAALLATLGVRAPLIGERGYSVQADSHDWPADLPTTVFEEHFVVFSRFNSGLRATSCIEFGRPDAPGDVRKWVLLERRIADLGVRFEGKRDRWVGPRPTLPDYVPAIGRLENAPKVLYAFGHAHLGLTMSAATAEIVAALATEAAPGVDLKPYAIERFK